MYALQVQLLVRQIPRTQGMHIFRSERRKLFEQLQERASFRFLELRKAIERHECPVVALNNNDSCPRDPIRLLSVYQMSDNIKRGPRPIWHLLTGRIALVFCRG